MKAKKVKAKVAFWWGEYRSDGALNIVSDECDEACDTPINIIPRADYRRLKAAERELKAKKTRKAKALLEYLQKMFPIEDKNVLRHALGGHSPKRQDRRLKSLEAKGEKARWKR